MALDLKSYSKQNLEDARDRYLEDLAAIPDHAFDASPAGAARSAAHFTYEIVCVNRRLATRMRGEDPGPFNPTLWETTPDEYRSRSLATQAFSESTQEFLDVLESIPAEQMEREIPTPSGTTTPFDLAMFCAMHVNYHDGQLNYIQAIHGDASIHWTD
jgi:uncharacterized damage-inducible protein DinB